MANSQLPMPSMSICIASIPIHACQHSGRYLVAFEKDTVISNTISAPLRDPLPSPLIGDSQSSNIAIEDDEEHVQKVLRKT